VTSLSKWAAARQLFEELLELEPELHEARIKEGSKGDPELEKLVRDLLFSHGDSRVELAPPTRDRLGAFEAVAGLGRAGGTAALDASEMPSQIGGFEILRELGSGGMGRVFEALQKEPHRAVALKVMHRGLDSEHAIRRFQLESEILAKLDHPNIARIFAAGTHVREDESAAPLPWFALELVTGGRNIVEYCSDQLLPLTARLALFLEVCEGVQHGHQKGVIHRDLKASNVLVDEAGRPKVIDFGIARVSGDWDQEAARLTFAGELVGTLGAMSPEQLNTASGDSDADIDTRTDVYSLGALLFELITGKPSFDLSDTSLPAAIARVRERGPRTPSGLVPGLAPELDWIVLCAMCPEREERYSSVAELAADLQRFLVAEPVLAGPPTARYRAKKFMQRNRAGVAAAAGFVFVLVAALVWVSTLYMRVDEQREVAVAQKAIAVQERDKAVAINEFMGSTLFAADPAFDGPEVRVVDVLGRVFTTSKTLFAKQPAVRATLLDTVGMIYTSLGQYADASRHYNESLAIFTELQGPEGYDALQVMLHQGYNLIDDESDPTAAVRTLRAVYAGFLDTVGPEDLATLHARINLGLALSWVNENEEAELHMRGAYEDLVRLYPERELKRAHFASLLGTFLQYTGELDEAEEMLAWAVKFQVAATGPEHPDALSLRNNYAGLLLALARTDEALSLMEEVYADCLKSVGEEHPETARYANGLGQTLIGAGQYDRAVEVFQASVASCERLHGAFHPLTLDARLGLGTSLYYAKDLEGAERELRTAIEGLVATLGEDDPRTQSTKNNLAMILQSGGKLEAAEVLLRENLEVRRRLTKGLNAELLGSINNLGFILLELGRLEEAEPLLKEALDGRRKTLGEAHPATLRSAINLARVWQLAGDAEGAIPLLEEVLRLGPDALGEDSQLLENVQDRLGELTEE